jgi:hypothetical protein
MARLSQKLPGSYRGAAAYLLSLSNLFSGEEPLSLFTINWQKIERAYGRSLSAEVRESLSSATRTFVLFEEPERTGKSVANVSRTIQAFKKRVSELQKAVPGSDDIATMIISTNFNDRSLRDQPFRILHNLLILFDVACKSALKELSGSPSSKKEGDAWNSWVRSLNKILRNNGLPVGVRKDARNKSKSDEPSRFTLLVSGVQSCLPRECRRHTHSLDALATAISRALGSNKTHAAI